MGNFSKRLRTSERAARVGINFRPFTARTVAEAAIRAAMLVVYLCNDYSAQRCEYLNCVLKNKLRNSSAKFYYVTLKNELGDDCDTFTSTFNTEK